MSDQTTPSNIEPLEPTSRRRPGWSAATVASVLLGLALAGVMTGAMFWIGDYYRGPPPSRGEEGRRKLRELRAGAQKELQTYGWVNQSEGVVRIPLDRAMQLLVEEGQREEPSAARQSADRPATN